MNYLADESVDRQIVDALREAGYKVTYVAEISSGISDTEVLQQANQSEAILITSDKEISVNLSFGGNLTTLAWFCYDYRD